MFVSREQKCNEMGNCEYWLGFIEDASDIDQFHGYLLVTAVT